MTDAMLNIINAQYKLKGIDASEFAKMKVSGMQFCISACHAQDLGHVSEMTAKGFFGLMQMETLIIVPKEKDLPLFSIDYISAMGKKSLYLELYDTVIGHLDTSNLDKTRKEFAYIPDLDPGKHWYDDIKLPQSLYKKTKQKEELEKLATAYLKAFISLKAERTSDIKEKTNKSSAYVNGLLTNGGPSTNVFMKHIGKEKTTKLFEKVLFGIAL